MTREEIIKELKEYEDGVDLEHATPFDKAILHAIKALEQEPILEKDGTLIVTTEHYENVGRVLVQYGTNGALFYQDQEPITKNDLGVDWESYKDVDGNSLDDLILEVLQNNFDCGNTYGYKVADKIIGLLPSVTPQEPILDKIRAEIDNINLNEVAAKYEDRFYEFQREVIKILDKYKAENEERND